MQADQPKNLLELPEPLLLAILEQVSQDPISLCAVARANRKLHQISNLVPKHANRTVDQQQLDSLVQHLSIYGKCVRSIRIDGGTYFSGPGYSYMNRITSLHQLPPLLKLSSLCLQHLHLQLQRRDGFRGLRVTAKHLPVKELRIWCCNVDDIQGLEGMLLQLPKLQHLSVGYLKGSFGCKSFLSWGVVQRLKQLTCLEVAGIFCGKQHAAQAASALQPLSALKGLLDLRLHAYCGNSNYRRYELRASMLSKLDRLTRLELSGFSFVEPAVLAGKPLQHLRLIACGLGDDGPAGFAQLLSQLQHLQQLTHLQMGKEVTWRGSGQWGRLEEGNPPPAAYAALTASSKLCHLDLSWCTLPAPVWRHAFPTGKLLPQLTTLIIQQPFWCGRAAPIGSQLVSCCPGLQHLDMRGLRKSAGTSMLTALQGLSGLRTLLIDPPQGSEMGGLIEVCKLTGLRQLDLSNCRGLPRGLLLQVTQLRQLTSLRCMGRPNQVLVFEAKDPEDEPVWQQVLRQHRNDHSNPDLAQQAATALAELCL